MAGLTWTDANSNTIDLNNGTSYALLLGIDGTGPPDADIMTVQTPTRDGATYVRTRLPERFIVAPLIVYGTSETNLASLRRTLSTRLNPRLGPGTLTYTIGGNAYIITAEVAKVGHSRDGAFTEKWAISWRCPDPAWRTSPANAPTLVVPNGGLTIPITIPLAVSVTSVTGTITNTGDLDSYPVITAAGPFSGLVITNNTTGKKVAFPALSVLAGQTLTIDMDARTAVVGTTNVMPSRSNDSAAWPLVPGANSVTALTSVGGTTVTVTYFSRYVGV